MVETIRCKPLTMIINLKRGIGRICCEVKASTNSVKYFSKLVNALERS